MSRRRAHAGVLLEAMLAVAIFVVAGLAILTAAGRARAAAESAALSARAADLARSAMSLIEVGRQTPESLDGPVAVWWSPGEPAGPDSQRTPRALDTGWELRIQTEPGPIDGLVRVVVEARRVDPSGRVDASRALARIVEGAAAGAPP